MIRPLLTVRKVRSLDPVKDERLRTAATQFAQYLSTYYTEKATDSKHGKMGPVGKVLSRMRSGKLGEQVLGEAIRIHEMTAKPRPGHKTASISADQLSALQEGVRALSELLESPEVSVADYKRVLEAVDAMIYYELARRKKEFFYEGQEAFRTHLRSKYAEESSLRDAWGDNSITWERIPYPSKGYERSKNEHIYKDIQEFLSQTTLEPVEEGQEI